MTFIDWKPQSYGHSPDLKTETNVRLVCGQDTISCPDPDWSPYCTYRYPAEDLVGHNGGPKIEDAFDCPCGDRDCDYEFDTLEAAKVTAQGSLPDNPTLRNEYPMADGLLDYFPNALAEVSRLSFVATQQHHPDQPMHWDRGKSLDHRNKIMRHLVDTGKFDDKGMRHSAMVAWRALALLQTELEEDEGVPLSRASR